MALDARQAGDGQHQDHRGQDIDHDLHQGHVRRRLQHHQQGHAQAGRAQGDDRRKIALQDDGCDGRADHNEDGQQAQDRQFALEVQRRRRQQKLRAAQRRRAQHGCGGQQQQHARQHDREIGAQFAALQAGGQIPPGDRCHPAHPGRCAGSPSGPRQHHDRPHPLAENEDQQADADRDGRQQQGHVEAGPQRQRHLDLAAVGGLGGVGQEVGQDLRLRRQAEEQRQRGRDGRRQPHNPAAPRGHGSSDRAAGPGRCPRPAGRPEPAAARRPPPPGRPSRCRWTAAAWDESSQPARSPWPGSRTSAANQP